MPHVSGFDVLAHMRSSERWRTAPCVVLTAAGQDSQHRRAMELGATNFITKPFSPKRLYALSAELAGVGSDAEPGETPSPAPGDAS